MQIFAAVCKIPQLIEAIIDFNKKTKIKMLITAIAIKGTEQHFDLDDFFSATF